MRPRRDDLHDDMDGSGQIIRTSMSSQLGFRYEDLRKATNDLNQSDQQACPGWLWFSLQGCASGWPGDRREAALPQLAAVDQLVLQRGEARQPGAAQEPHQAPRVQRRGSREPPRLRVPLQHQPRSLPL
uniref:Uncharacterized protein n=2 Tax=Triticum urartu TaxID=4572 RepID=A0A8R7QY84_TRIUA